MNTNVMMVEQLDMDGNFIELFEFEYVGQQADQMFDAMCKINDYTNSLTGVDTYLRPIARYHAGVWYSS